MRLKWNETGHKKWETGCDNGVLFVLGADGTYGEGIAWEGLTKVTEQPSGSEPQKFYANNILYSNILSIEEYKATVEAYTYPDEFEECDGARELFDGISIGQQDRKKFAFCYRTKIGNDVTQDLGYKINIIYGCLAAPSDKDHETVNDSPNLTQFSWEVSTTPIEVENHKPTSVLIIDSTKVSAANYKALEDYIYGTDPVSSGAEGTPSRLPLPDDIATIISQG